MSQAVAGLLSDLEIERVIAGLVRGNPRYHMPRQTTGVSASSGTLAAIRMEALTASAHYPIITSLCDENASVTPSSRNPPLRLANRDSATVSVITAGRISIAADPMPRTD